MADWSGGIYRERQKNDNPLGKILYVWNYMQGHSDGGGYRYLYPPKSAQVNFLWGKNNVRTAIQQFYTPQKTYTPQNKFLATPLIIGDFSTKFLARPVCCAALQVQLLVDWALAVE